MAWFEGTHTETRTLPHSVEAVRAHFSDLEQVAKNTTDLESHSIAGDVLTMHMKEQNHGIVKFKGHVECRFTLDGDTLTWEAVGDTNLKQSGKATFAADGAGTKLEYTETIAIDLGIPKVMAAGLKPMIAPMLAKEVKGYVERMAGSVGN